MFEFSGLCDSLDGLFNSFKGWEKGIRERERNVIALMAEMQIVLGRQRLKEYVRALDELTTNE